MIEIKGVHNMQRLAITIAVLIVALCTPAFSDNSIATRINNGTKLLLKEGTDSLFYVYGDENGAVQLAYGDDGTWDEEQVVSLRDYPAIASDSTGKRWVAVHLSCVQLGDLAVQEVYYYDDAWVAETLYSGQGDEFYIGPPSIAGASSTTTGVVYVAFRREDKQWPYAKSVVLTKYNGTAAASRVVTTDVGSSDPAIAVEPYKTDSFIVHVTWQTSDDVIKHAYCVDGTGSGVPNMTTWIGTVSDPNDEACHPSIGADHGRVVIAWSQDSPPDVYARERLLGTWGLEANQSGTYDSSDYATIALGDAVVVAWEEANSASDHDIEGHVDFTRDITIHNCDTIASYPHITLQRDGEYLYLHSIWSEPDYVVGYNNIDIWDMGGEGQQSMGSGLTMTKPSLAGCLPNPFRGRTQIGYTLPAASNVTLQVYDATGRPVRTLASGLQKAGAYSVSWDARDAGGKQLPCGVYFYRLDTPGFVSMKQAVVTR
jgi:hypothetical protein